MPLLRFPLAAVLGVSLFLHGCGAPLFRAVGPDHQPPAQRVSDRWQAPSTPVPHGGDPGELSRWWARFDDPMLLRMIDAAQRASPGLAQAAAAIARARAEAVAAGAAGLPAVDAITGLNRAAITFGGPALLRTQAQIGAQASWEIDLFGRLARGREAARARLDAQAIRWHEARVSVAADVADAHLSWRHCAAQFDLIREDAASRARTAELTGLAARAGLQAPATAALATASAADAAASITRQQSQCEFALKALVALTALPESELRAGLDAARARRPGMLAATHFTLEPVPARLLAQRPDVAAAERDLAAASAEVGVAEAQRYPALSLSGNILPTRLWFNGAPPIAVSTWSIGPSLILPLFDGGRREAASEAARGAWKAAEAVYQARARQAVREVEEALIRIDAAMRRETDVATAAAQYTRHFEATGVRQRAGLGSLIEMEDTRRTALAARSAQLALEQERTAAWIALYRAAGGGWTDDGKRSP